MVDHSQEMIEVFEYPACAGGPPVVDWDGWTEAPESNSSAGWVDEAAGMHEGQQTIDERLAEHGRRSFAAGRERGLEEGRAAEREAHAAAHHTDQQQHKRQLAALIEKVGAARESFFYAAEQETVSLALAVAARVLRREAQMDPLLLTGAVRVALGQMASGAEARLLVPAAELELWNETISLLPNLAVKPVVAAGARMRLGDCVIESKVGTVDLGVGTQLQEIERGFFDRAGADGQPALDKRQEVEVESPQ